MTRFLLVLISFVTLNAGAATVKPQDVAIDIRHGELTTHFKVDVKTNTITMKNSHGLNRSRKFDASDIKFIFTKAQELPKNKSFPYECGRAQMEVTIGEGKTAAHKRSCFGMKSISSEQYQNLANVLAVSI